MEELYQLSREQLIQIAMNLGNQTDAYIYDPLTDQQLRDYIVNKAVILCLNKCKH